jgi:hypothetical protein
MVSDLSELSSLSYSFEELKCFSSGIAVFTVRTKLDAKGHLCPCKQSQKAGGSAVPNACSQPRLASPRLISGVDAKPKSSSVALGSWKWNPVWDRDGKEFDLSFWHLPSLRSPSLLEHLWGWHSRGSRHAQPLQPGGCHAPHS